VAALPYDVFSREEAAAEIARHPKSFLRIDKTTALLPKEISEYDPQVYSLAYELFNKDIHDGIFLNEDISAYYIYRLIKQGRAQTAIIACVSVDEYKSGVIKRHENTRAHKKQDRIDHILALGAQSSPVFLAYRPIACLSQLLIKCMNEATPLYDFCSPDAVSHSVWRIAEPDVVAQIQEAFAGVDALYIADGHHRAAAAVTVSEQLAAKAEQQQYSVTEQQQYAGVKLQQCAELEQQCSEARHFLAALFSADELMIHGYNRVVAGMGNNTPKQLLQKIGETFTVQKLPLCKEAEGLSNNTQPCHCGHDTQSAGLLSKTVDQEKDDNEFFGYKPTQRGQIAMYIANDNGENDLRDASDKGTNANNAGDANANAGSWYLLSIPEALRSKDPVDGLDVAILHEHLIAPILGITDPKSDSRISYVGGVRGLKFLQERANKQNGVAFALFPVTLEELFAVADANRLMPPKSTWFDPKPLSGLFLHKIKKSDN
jgi:uncharacterized protein (DUF1015 family)